MDTTDPLSWLTDLYRRGITSVMVEGGTQVLQQMIVAQAWDEARIETSPRRIGQGVTAPAIDGRVQEKYHLDGNQIITMTPNR